MWRVMASRWQCHDNKWTEQKQKMTMGNRKGSGFGNSSFVFCTLVEQQRLESCSHNQGRCIFLNSLTHGRPAIRLFYPENINHTHTLALPWSRSKTLCQRISWTQSFFLFFFVSNVNHAALAKHQSCFSAMLVLDCVLIAWIIVSDVRDTCKDQSTHHAEPARSLPSRFQTSSCPPGLVQH